MQGQAHAYTLALLATECTTPFVNLRWVLDKVSGSCRMGGGHRLCKPWPTTRQLLYLFFHGRKQWGLFRGLMQVLCGRLAPAAAKEGLTCKQSGALLPR